ncbi:MAG: hypothetical protein IJ333_06070, partial [Clostridia bacterium]|nr:hypothetical protein [Clostridia bacterium]
EPKDQKSDIEELIARINTLQQVDSVIEDSKKVIHSHENEDYQEPLPPKDAVVDEAIFDAVKSGKKDQYAVKEKSALRRLLDEDEDENDEEEELKAASRLYDDVQEDIEDVESEDDRDAIYRDLKNIVGKMAVKTVALFLVSLISVGLFIIGLNGDTFEFANNTIWFQLALLAVDLACCGLSFGIFTQGLAKLLRFQADSDTLLALFFVSLTVMRVACMIRPEIQVHPMYLEPMLAIGLYFNVLSKKKIATNIKKNFKATGSPGDKLTATLQPSCEVKNELILETGEGGEVIYAHRTGLVSQYIDHSYSDFDCDRRLYRFLFGTVLLIVVGTVAVSQLTGWEAALQFPAAAFALCVPFFSRYYYAASIQKNGRKIRKNGGILTSVASVKELEDADLLMVSEEDFLGKDAVLLQGVKALGTLQIDELITDIAALYNCVGTPLKRLFLKMIDQKSVQLPRVDDIYYHNGLGYSCLIHSKMFLVGNWELMQQFNVDFPKQFSQLQLKGCHYPVYVAYQNAPAGIFITSYERNETTERAVELAVAEQVSIGLISNDFLFDRKLLQTLYPEAHESLFHFISPKTGEACKPFLARQEKAPDLIASTKGMQGLLSCLYGSSKLLTALKINRMIRLLYTVLSIGLIIFIALAGYSEDTALQILIFQSIWTAVVYLVCTFCK